MEGDMNKAVQAVIGLGLLCFGFTQAVAAVDTSKLKRVTQTLVTPPAVPKHDQVAVGGPKIVQVRLETIEKQVEISPGAKAWALTFNGSVPGPLIVVHEGDYVELTIANPKESSLAHNVDFHAATGALGAAQVTMVQPGEEKVVRFKAIKPGVFIYHCAPGGTMIPFHVISGMSGAIMVLPRDGLKDAQGKPYTYDKAYYIGESDWYLPKDAKGAYKEYDSPAAGMADMLEVARGLIPTHVVFNGAEGSITGDNAWAANVGEKALFIHSQANRVSYPHLIGGHADLYWVGGSFSDTPLTSQETWIVPAGSAVAAAYEFKQPGLYVYLSHNLIEAVLLGAAAHMNVEGDWNHDLMHPAPEGLSAADEH